MPDPTAETPILVSDLVHWKETLAAIFSHFHAHDLAEQYRRLDQRPRRSPLTNATGDALMKLEAYLDALEDEEPVDE